MQGRCFLFTGKKDQARQLFIDNHPKIQSPEFRAAALATICDVTFEKSEWENNRYLVARVIGLGADEYEVQLLQEFDSVVQRFERVLK